MQGQGLKPNIHSYSTTISPCWEVIWLARCTKASARDAGSGIESICQHLQCCHKHWGEGPNGMRHWSSVQKCRVRHPCTLDIWVKYAQFGLAPQISHIIVPGSGCQDFRVCKFLMRISNFACRVDRSGTFATSARWCLARNTKAVGVGVCENTPEVLLHLAKATASLAVGYGLTQINLPSGVVVMVIVVGIF